MSSTTPSAPPYLRLVAPLFTAAPPLADVPASREPQDRRVQLVIAAMTADLSQPHTLSSLAATVELCPRQCERLFQSEIGRSPLQYLHDLRLARAGELLVTGFKSVQAIAEEVGFRQVEYFHRVFKARYGCTPLAYRKQSESAVVVKKIA